MVWFSFHELLNCEVKIFQEMGSIGRGIKRYHIPSQSVQVLKKIQNLFVFTG